MPGSTPSSGGGRQERDMELVPFSTSLRSGQRVYVREVCPADRGLLTIGFAKLSERSKHFRFLAAHSRLTEAELDQFTSTNDVDHVAIGALAENGQERDPAGIARYVRLNRTSSAAEFAITIVDRYQGQGLGLLLFGVLAKFAVISGLDEFIAAVHRDNAAMLGLFDELDGRRVFLGGADVEVRVPIHDDPTLYPDTPSGGAVRAAYRIAEIG